MGIEITGPCKVRLRNGWEGPVAIRNGCDPWAVTAAGSKSESWAWKRNGRYRGDEQDSPFDIIEPPTPACDEEEPNGDLITGPGRYPTREGKVVKVAGPAKDSYLKAMGFAWEGLLKGAYGPTGWHSNGAWFNTGQLGASRDIIGPRIPDHLSDEAAAAHARMVAENLRRKEAEGAPNDPELAKPEPPKLEEEIGEGLWWATWAGGAHGVRKFEVIRVPLHEGFAAAWIGAKYDDGHVDKHISPIRPDGRFGNSLGLQLIRRVKQPTIAPYSSDADKGAMFGKAVRRKRDGQELVVIGVDCGGVTIKGSISPTWESLARDWEHLDSTPCGFVTAGDPWETT